MTRSLDPPTTVRQIWPVLTILVISISTLVGCTSSTTHGKINGTVTLDGEPLSEGVVRFVPMDGKSQTASAPISNGKFIATVPVGTTRVEFSAPRIVGKQKMYETDDSPEVDMVSELLPPKYNVASQIQMDVTTGHTDRHFELSSE